MSQPKFIIFIFLFSNIIFADSQSLLFKAILRGDLIETQSAIDGTWYRKKAQLDHIASKKPFTGQTPLTLAISLAASGTHLSIAQKLLEHGANPNLSDGKNITPIFLASSLGFVSLVELMLEKEALTNITNEHGQTPIFIAAANGHEDIVKLLLDKADIRHKDNSGQTLLIIAAKHGHMNIVDLLLENSEIDQVDNKGQSALYLAVLNGHEET